MSGSEENPAEIISIARAGDACFSELQELISHNPKAEIPDESLASLHLLFGKNFAKALEVLDGGGIVCYIGEKTGRMVYKVAGRRAGDEYIVFPAHYCSCHSFMYDVVGERVAVYCKHQLAARLATVLGRLNVIKTSDVAIAEMLLSHCD